MSLWQGDYLPFHSGMPSSDPSSLPAQLITVPDVEAFLTGTPFASCSVTQLSGGGINYLYRLHLLASFEGSQTVVLKHAQAFWKSSVTTRWEVERQIFEVEAMTRVRRCLSPDSLVKVPVIYHFDSHNHFIIMEDCGADALTLTTFLSSGNVSPLQAEIIGTAIGNFIALVHEWSRSNPDGILDLFEKSLHAKKTMAGMNYLRAVDTLQRADEDDLSLLPDFEMDSFDTRVISELTEGYYSKMMSARVPGRDVFLMGDLWSENILVNVHQDSISLHILDWELARTGLAGSEIGLFCASTRLLGRVNEAVSEPAASVMLRNFLDAYSRVSSRDACLAQDALAHWGITYVFWIPRDEVVQAFVREGVKFLVRCRDEDFLAQSPVKGLLPELNA